MPQEGGRGDDGKDVDELHLVISQEGQQESWISSNQDGGILQALNSPLSYGLITFAFGNDM